MNQHEDIPPTNSTRNPGEKPSGFKRLLLCCRKYQANCTQHYRQIKIKTASICRWIWWALNVDIVRDSSATALCTILIVIATGVYSYFAYLQWDATRQAADAATSAAHTAQIALTTDSKSNIEIPAQLKSQSAAMRENATASTLQAQAFISIQRAFINVEIAPATRLKDSSWQFVAQWDNNGVTPAQNAFTYTTLY